MTSLTRFIMLGWRNNSMLRVGDDNKMEDFINEMKSSNKYIFETVSTGFKAAPSTLKILRAGLKQNGKSIEEIAERLRNQVCTDEEIKIYTQELNERYDGGVEFVKVNDIQIRHNQLFFFYVFRNVKPMTCKEFDDKFGSDELYYPYWPCTIIRAEEGD
jgi:hypothetical protein